MSLNWKKRCIKKKIVHCIYIWSRFIFWKTAESCIFYPALNYKNYIIQFSFDFCSFAYNVDIAFDFVEHVVVSHFLKKLDLRF